MNRNHPTAPRTIHQKITRAFSLYRIVLILLLVTMFFLPQASAVEDMWTAANRIIKDVYSKIAAISTVLAGLMSAVAVIGAKMSGTQQKADSAWEWLKRVWLAWVIINGIGAFIAYVRPLFDGLATLE
ncbi:hypothetical protein [Agathobaculum desmolans]|uniref:hypothetical protein n=1 Tax=Agathobaculum desmolans TaxID=39484 RepID=UPI0039932C26